MKKNLHIIIISVLFSVVLWGSISLSDDYYATVELPLRLINFPEGFTTGSDIPETISIKVKGRGWKLVSMSLGSESDFRVSVNSDTGWKTASLPNYLSDNNWLSSDMQVIDIIPDSIAFYIEPVINRTLPVSPELDLKFRSGYGLATPVKIIPDSVEVYGPKSKLQKLTSVSTESITLPDLDRYTQQYVNLQGTRGMVYENNQVSVILDVQRIVDKQFDDIKIEVSGVPPDKEVILLPNRISIGLQGGIEILGKLKNSDFIANLQFNAIVMDTIGSVKPSVDVPDNTRLLYIKPERLRYVIKEFD
ncbi:MAG: hypothetical protein Kow0098_17580 [Ignavibacteriaceae bacterium]